MTTTLPTLDEVQQLPAVLKRTVTPDFIDENGHMNIGRYLELDATAADLVFQQAGVDNGYRAERRMGVFTAEQHLQYYSELHLGEEISVHPRLLARSGKVVHLIVFLVDGTHGRLANTLEVTLVHVGMDTRRPTDLPPDVAAVLDEMLAEHRALSWDAPVCGVMGIRRPV